MEIPVAEMLERMADVYDEPFADSSNIPTYLVAEFARRYVKVVLSGDGGDELFGGYEWYSWLLASEAARSGAVALGWTQLTALTWRVMTKASLHFHRQRDAAIRAYRASLSRRRHHDLWERHLAFATGLKVDRSALWNRRAPQETEAAIREVYTPSPGVQAMDRATDFDVRCYLPGDILVKVDRAAMAHGLETRAPFLDVDLVEFVWGLPWHLRFRDGSLKYLLREACADLWPEAVRNRSKQGFGAPVGSWIQRPDVQSLMKRLCAPNSPLMAVLPGARSTLPGLNPQLSWTRLCLGLWLEKRSECLSSPS
jgi:asparagine synthase (glutamine-hydrolysing)